MIQKKKTEIILEVDQKPKFKPDEKAHLRSLTYVYLVDMSYMHHDL